MDMKNGLQWGSKFRASSVFEWSFSAGTWHLNSGPFENQTTKKPEQALVHSITGSEIKWANGHFLLASNFWNGN